MEGFRQLFWLRAFDFYLAIVYTGIIAEKQGNAMPQIVVNQYSHYRTGEKIQDGQEERISRGTILFPIQYYLNNTADPRYDLPVMWHTDFEIIHILSGSYKAFICDREFLLEKGDIAIIPSRQLHGDGRGKGQSLYESIVFDPEMIRLHSYAPDSFLSGILNGTIILTNFIPHTNGAIQAIARQLFDAIKIQQEGYEFVVTGSLLLFFGEIKRQQLYIWKKSLSPGKRKQTEQIEQVLEFIKQNYNKNLSLEDLAATTRLSPKYFCRLFREIIGHSPIEYLNWFRVNMACSALRSSEDKLSDIASDCGFNDFSYFIKTFRRYKNVTPLVYRNMNVRQSEASGL